MIIPPPDITTSNSYASALTEYRTVCEVAKSVRQEYNNHIKSNIALLTLHNPTASEKSISRTIPIGHNNNLTVDILQSPLSGVGGLLWTSSEIAAEEVTRLLKNIGSEDTIVELGCGAAALPSMAAAMIFPATVIATDTDIVIEKTRENIIRNLKDKDLCGILEVRECDWGENHSDGTVEFSIQATAVIAADVIYAYRNFDALVATISSILKPNGTFILTYAQRDEASERRFFDKLKFDAGIDARIVSTYERSGQTLFTMYGTKSPSLDCGIYL